MPKIKDNVAYVDIDFDYVIKNIKLDIPEKQNWSLELFIDFLIEPLTQQTTIRYEY